MKLIAGSVAALFVYKARSGEQSQRLDFLTRKKNPPSCAKIKTMTSPEKNKPHSSSPERQMMEAKGEVLRCEMVIRKWRLVAIIIIISISQGSK